MERWIFLSAAASLLASCSPSVETRISSAGTAFAPAGFALAANSPETPELRYAQSLVSETLVSRGFKAVDAAPLNLEVTMSVRPAALALGTSTGPDSLAKAKRKKPLQSCEDREYRIGVALTRIGDGALLYRGTAAEYHCNMPLAQALPALIDAALADLGKPRGDYAVVRKAQD
jgi:hypothetical protein